MSMPFTVYTCGRCDFKGSSMAIWGRYSYEGPAGLVPLERQIAWCAGCADLVPMEVLPSTSKALELEREIAETEERIAAFRSAAQRERGFFGKLFNSRVALPDDLEEADTRRYGQEQELKDLRIRSALLSKRKSGARCLRCGSTSATPLPRVPVLPGSDRNPGPPTAIGWQHPKCGGQFMASRSGVRIAKRLQHRVYTPEGDALRMEDA